MCVLVYLIAWFDIAPGQSIDLWLADNFSIIGLAFGQN